MGKFKDSIVGLREFYGTKCSDCPYSREKKDGTFKCALHFDSKNRKSLLKGCPYIDIHYKDIDSNNSLVNLLFEFDYNVCRNYAKELFINIKK